MQLTPDEEMGGKKSRRVPLTQRVTGSARRSAFKKLKWDTSNARSQPERQDPRHQFPVTPGPRKLAMHPKHGDHPRSRPKITASQEAPHQELKVARHKPHGEL